MSLIHNHNFIAALHTQRQEFLSVLKHRLKTPVFGARRILSLILEGAFGPVNDRQLPVLRELLSNADKLSAVMDNLIEIYTYQNGNKVLDIRTHNAASLCDSVMTKYARAASTKDIKLGTGVIDRTLELRCDRREITVLLDNLVENAIENAETAVTVDLVERDGQIEFSVTDDGKGIIPGDQDGLFSHFYEGSSDGRRPATTGTGLCLCQQIAFAHNGMVSCESSPGRPTVFRVHIPKRHPGR